VSRRGRWVERGKAALLALAVASAFSAIVAANNRYAREAFDLPELTWGVLLWREMSVWYAWVAVTPLIVLLCRHFPLAWRRWRNILVHLLAMPAIMAIAIALLIVARLPVEPLDDGGLLGRILQSFRMSFGVILLTYSVLLAIFHALAHARRQRQLELQLAHARLDQLTAQVHPHFVFNVLHGISSLIEEDPPAARRMIANLGDLLRSSSELDGAGEVALAVELEWARRYVDLQRLRFADRLTVSMDVPDGVSRALVPRFLLQPLIENSIRHGLDRRPEGLRVDVGAVVLDGTLRITVADDGPGFHDNGTPAGIGLANLRARLQSLYGAGAELRAANRPEGGACVEVRVPVAGAKTGSSPA
jgi:sensor histidine kinase YesM